MKEKQAALCIAFEALDRERQMDVLQKEGIYIGKMKTKSETKLLYQYQSFYVEIVYAVYRTHIIAVHCFTDTNIIDHYLSSTDFDPHGLG